MPGPVHRARVGRLIHPDRVLGDMGGLGEDRLARPIVHRIGDRRVGNRAFGGLSRMRGGPGRRGRVLAHRLTRPRRPGIAVAGIGAGRSISGRTTSWRSISWRSISGRADDPGQAQGTLGEGDRLVHHQLGGADPEPEWSDK
jgi:hypothetical protein